MKVIEHWRLYLIWTKHPFVIETDHKNLTYRKSPRKLMGRTTQWHKKLQNYNFKIIHIQGKHNMLVDTLSRPNDDERQTEERMIALIPSEAFLNLADTDPTSSLEYQLSKQQREHQKWIEDLSKQHQYWCNRGLWKNPEGKLVIPPDDALRR
jgi:hypothetical protein